MTFADRLREDNRRAVEAIYLAPMTPAQIKEFRRYYNRRELLAYSYDEAVKATKKAVNG